MKQIYVMRHSEPLKCNNIENGDSLQVKNEKWTLTENGESLNEVLDREINAIFKILDEYSDKKILIVGHSTALATLFSKWCEVQYTGNINLMEKYFLMEYGIFVRHLN